MIRNFKQWTRSTLYTNRYRTPEAFMHERFVLWRHRKTATKLEGLEAPLET